jgi:hypothetical protein
MKAPGVPGWLCGAPGGRLARAQEAVARRRLVHGAAVPSSSSGRATLTASACRMRFLTVSGFIPRSAAHARSDCRSPTLGRTLRLHQLIRGTSSVWPWPRKISLPQVSDTSMMGRTPAEDRRRVAAMLSMLTRSARRWSASTIR